MKYLKFLLIVMLCQQIVGCTKTHEFGPYQGKVVERDTLKPIEGAVVFIEFLIRAPGLGGESGYFGDAVETLTDKNGEFYIPIQKTTFTKRSLTQLGHHWDEDGYVIIFKPGYGTFPWHKNSAPTFSPTYSIPPKQYVTIQLPKLHSIEERKRNMHFSTGLGVPNDKKMNLLRLECIERKRIGLEPTVNCCEDEK
ncbi:putative Lipoprotein [uncultured Desulfobacterium sp.]|uniref:Putative Lipoprotein n=1 Tax=uncultured Desulfobacterium sp. TaxID=201089 RepID=A0A445MYQ0_9BACT|nr:putative Lipoprotein [uncultured Desulfobacterium sp.]